MDFLKLSKVDQCWFEKGTATLSSPASGALHLMTYHLLFCRQSDQCELWLPYSNIMSIESRQTALIPQQSSLSGKLLVYVLEVTSRDFLCFRLMFGSDREGRDVLMSINAALASISPNSLAQHYAFNYEPKFPYSSDGWKLYSVVDEYDRLGVGGSDNAWRLSDSNSSYSISPTYPRTLIVPAKISDAVIFHAAKFRSRGRLPCLTYIHKENKATITRSSQPLVGIQSKRSIQDEKLIEAIFDTNNSILKCVMNLIIDARPLGNAVANRALGAGYESTENYRGCKRMFMGIENIHVMRDAQNKFVDTVLNQSGGTVEKFVSALDSSSWLKHIKIILDSTCIITEKIRGNGNVLIHCSDGWDRTAQLSSLASICLDPYYRTIRGLQILIEKEWLSFGHKFSERLGHFVHYFKSTGNAKKEQEMAPVFLQFLECVHHQRRQFPAEFEYNDKLLIDIYKHAQMCQFGTFLLNCEQERASADLSKRTCSVWSFIDENISTYKSSLYQPSLGCLDVQTGSKEVVRLWNEMYAYYDEEMFPELDSDTNPYRRQCPISVEQALAYTDERLRELEDIEKLIDSSKTSAEVAKKFMSPQMKQSICYCCKGRIFSFDVQVRCRSCAFVVCHNCSRYKHHVTETLICGNCKKETN